MIRIACAALAAAFPLLCAAAPNAASQRPLMPVYDDPAKLTQACERVLERGRKALAAMAKRSGGAGFFQEWNRLQIGLEDTNPMYLLGEVHPDKAVRDAAEPCLQKATTLNTEIFQDERLFRRVQAAKPVNAVQRKLKKDLVEGFEDSGVALPPEKRRRAKEIFDKLEELRQAYDRNVRDDPTKVAFTPAEMEGLPEAYLKMHEKSRDKDGNYVLGLDYPSYLPFMQNARQETARRRYYVAKLNEGGAKNLELLEEIFRGCARSSQASTACRASRTTPCAARWWAAPKWSRNSSATCTPPSRSWRRRRSRSCAPRRRRSRAGRLRRCASSAGT